MEDGGHLLQVEQLVGGQLGQALHDLFQLPVRGADEVVLGHQAAVVLDAAHELLELQQHEAALGAELDDVLLDLVGDAPHHLGPLEDRDGVAHGDEVLDLEGRQRAGDGVEAVLVALQGLQGLVGLGQHPGDGLERVLLVVAVDRDDRHGLRHRDDRHVDLAGHPLGGAVPGAGLRRGDVGVGHEVHVAPGHPRAVGGQNEGAVHLGQLRQPLGGELGVEQEPAGAHRQHLRPVADDDQGALVGLEDAIDTVTQGGARRHHPQCIE